MSEEEIKNAIANDKDVPYYIKECAKFADEVIAGAITEDEKEDVGNFNDQFACHLEAVSEIAEHWMRNCH